MARFRWSISGRFYPPILRLPTPTPLQPEYEFYFRRLNSRSTLFWPNAIGSSAEKIPTLAQARDRYFQLSAQLKAPMQIIGSWSPHGELEFLIAIRGYFATQEKAVSYQDHLPNQWAAQARVIRNLPAGAKLFADAYAAGVREQ